MPYPLSLRECSCWNGNLRLQDHCLATSNLEPVGIRGHTALALCLLGRQGAFTVILSQTSLFLRSTSLVSKGLSYEKFLGYGHHLSASGVQPSLWSRYQQERRAGEQAKRGVQTCLFQLLYLIAAPSLLLILLYNYRKRGER